jgi:hypothetical protein
MLDLFGLGNIGTTIALVLGALAALGGALWRAGKQGEQKAKGKADADYISERKRQDEIDVGNDASDADRIRMLEAIRDRKRAGKN